MEFGIPAPSDSLVAGPGRILSELWPESAVKFLVYLMSDGSLAVDIRGKRPDGIFISLWEDGSAQCSGEIGGKVWRKPYTSSQDVPDDDLLDELFKLRLGAREE